MGGQKKKTPSLNGDDRRQEVEKRKSAGIRVALERNLKRVRIDADWLLPASKLRVQELGVAPSLPVAQPHSHAPKPAVVAACRRFGYFDRIADTPSRAHAFHEPHNLPLGCPGLGKMQRVAQAES